MSRLYPRNRDLSRPIERIRLIVEGSEEGRFDRFLRRHVPWRSRAGLRKLIVEGRARLNGAARKPATRVRSGDAVEIEVARKIAGPPPPEPPIEILFEDEHLFALAKPPGVVVHPVGPHQEGTLLQALHRRVREQVPKGPLPKLAHRLDQQTSGVLLVARTDAVRAAFSEQMARGRVRKLYDALVLGRTAWRSREVDAPIGPVADSRILMCVDAAAGKPARTTFTLAERFAFATRLRVEIHTGRTHQIRVHAAHLGHPLLGDHLYGDGIPILPGGGFCLHARRVRFRHPVTGRELEIEAPRPESFERAVAVLRAAQAQVE